MLTRTKFRRAMVRANDVFGCTRAERSPEEVAADALIRRNIQQQDVLALRWAGSTDPHAFAYGLHPVRAYPRGGNGALLYGGPQ